MKRIILGIMVGASALTGMAQTNFRAISFDEAMAAAKQENKQVFIDFYTDWCGPCKMMARDVFPQKAVGDFLNSRFVSIKLNAEKEGKELAARYEVKAYPTYIILDAEGKVQADIKGAMEGNAFIDKVKSSLDPDMTPQRMEERYKAGERDPQFMNNYIYSFLEQGKEAEGFRLINEYFDSLTEAQRLRPENAFLFTRYTVDIESPTGKFMVAHRTEFDPTVRKEINDRVDRLFNAAVVSYFSGYRLRSGNYKPEEYQALKKQIEALGLDKKYPYAPMFVLIESRAKDDDKTFLALCDKEYGKLDEKDRDLLIMNMGRLFEPAGTDKETLKAVSKFIRTRLPELSPSTISLAGRVLNEIESNLK